MGSCQFASYLRLISRVEEGVGLRHVCGRMGVLDVSSPFPFCSS